MDDIYIILAFLSFIPGMHPNTYCSMFNSHSMIEYVIGFAMIVSLLSIPLFYSSSDSTLGPVIGKMFRNNYNLIYVYIVFFTIGMMYGIILGGLYELTYFLKNYRIYIYLLTFFLIFYYLSRKNTIFILATLLSGFWGLLVIDEKYMFHIFAGMFGVTYIVKNLIESDKNSNKNNNNEYIMEKIQPEVLLYMSFGVVVGFFSLLFPGISSPSIFGSLFVSITNPYHYITYYSTMIGFQSTASIYYYYYTGNVRNGYVACIEKESEILRMLIGGILGIICLYIVLNYFININIPKWLNGIALIIILYYSYHLDNQYGILITLGSGLVSYINMYIIRAGPDSNMGVILFPTLVLITRSLLNY